MRNQQRDREVTDYYVEKGWHIKRIWEHEIRKDINQVADDLADYINEIRLGQKPDSMSEAKKLVSYESGKVNELPIIAAEAEEKKRYGK